MKGLHILAVLLILTPLAAAHAGHGDHDNPEAFFTTPTHPDVDEGLFVGMTVLLAGIAVVWSAYRYRTGVWGRESG